MPIRDFTFRDIFFICDLDEKEFSKYNGPCAMASLRCMAEPTTQTLIYAHDQLPNLQLGFAIVQWKKDHSYLAEIATTPDGRRQGIGLALIEESARRMCAICPHHVMLLDVAEHNLDAQRLFTRFGFQLQNRISTKYKSGQSALRMVKHF
jgi:ribosomal protein S18 acetylase RimI-like enzyme